jgi:hypothetical protein
VGEQGRQANDVGPNTTTDASKRVSSGASQPEGESESNRNLNGAEKTQKTVAKPEPKYTKYLKGDDGNIYGIRIDGQPVRIMKAEKPTVKYGIREYPNPDYGKYLEALEKYGLSEKANAKIGLMR